jgi:5-formyltetrahydrofolate cyclo-ligase
MAELDPEFRRAQSMQAAHRLFELPEWIRAEVVMVFLSLPTEIDTTAIVLSAWQHRKRVLAPKVSWEQRRMIPVEINSLTDDLRVTDFGLREPATGRPFEIRLIDFLLVPGLGFDQYGNRLGRGRGFYDRFLAHTEFEGVSCALAFESQVVDAVPVGPGDRPVDLLVTNEQVRTFRKPARKKA